MKLLRLLVCWLVDLRPGDHFAFRRCGACGVRRGWCARCADDEEQA